MSKIFGYARVSSRGQEDNTSLELQRIALRKAGATEVFVDSGVSATIPWAERPEGAKLFAAMGIGDQVVVTKLDRAFRSLDDFAVTCKRLRSEGLDICILELGGMPMLADRIGSFLLTVLAAAAEMERSLILERTSEGRMARIQEGVHVGGKAPWGHTIIGENIVVAEPWYYDARHFAVKAAADGASLRQIAAAIKIKWPKCGSVSAPTVAKLVQGSPTHSRKEEDGGLIG